MAIHVLHTYIDMVLQVQYFSFELLRRYFWLVATARYTRFSGRHVGHYTYTEQCMSLVIHIGARHQKAKKLCSRRYREGVFIMYSLRLFWRICTLQ